MKYVKVKSLKHLKEVLKDADAGEDFILRLKGGLHSSKHMSYDGEVFYITNYIDSSEQKLNDKEMMNKEFTNIGYGIEKGAFYWEKDDEI